MRLRTNARTDIARLICGAIQFTRPEIGSSGDMFNWRTIYQFIGPSKLKIVENPLFLH
jgi:hypothetical protein